MPTIVKLPQLGESVAEGTIGRWLKQPGERVERDEPLVEVLTDKVNAEVPSPVSGVLREILAAEGSTVAVKTDIAVIAEGADVDASVAPVAGAPAPSPAAPASVGASAPTPPPFTFEDAPGGGPTSSARAAEQGAGGAPPDGGAKRFYTPVVLRLAQEHGLDLAALHGTGLGGRVTRKDVERALAERTAAPVSPRAPTEAGQRPGAGAPLVLGAPEAEAPRAAAAAGADEVRELTPMRRAIAQHMARSRAEIPDAWSMVEVDVTNLVRYRASVQAEWLPREGYELTYLPFFVKAVLAGLRAVPELNASWEGDRVVYHRQHHLGIAVSVAQGLVVPVLRGADQLSVAGIARGLREIVQKTRGGKLTPDDLEGATFTVNNPGSLGSIMSQPIIPVGQAGIVTMEAISKRPVVTGDDAIAIRSMMHCCLSFDHRVLDGALALTFLRTVKDQLEAAEQSVY